MNKFYQIFSSKWNLFSTFLLILFSLNLKGQSVQNRKWEYSKVVYTSSTKNSIIITNSLPKGGGLVYHKGKEYNYFIFWANIRNESNSPLEFQIKFPTLNFFNADKSHFKVGFTKAKMTIDKVQDFDYGLTDIPSLLNNESNQLKSLKNSILSKKEYLFYIPIFIHKSKWPVRAEFILKDKELFYKVAAGTDTVMFPCGGIGFLN